MLEAVPCVYTLRKEILVQVVVACRLPMSVYTSYLLMLLSVFCVCFLCFCVFCIFLFCVFLAFLFTTALVLFSSVSVQFSCKATNSLSAVSALFPWSAGAVHAIATNLPLSVSLDIIITAPVVSLLHRIRTSSVRLRLGTGRPGRC